MKQIKFTCLYCDHKWYITTLNSNSPPTACPRCKDTHIKAKILDSTNSVDYYIGCPPFPEPKKERDAEDYVFDYIGMGVE